MIPASDLEAEVLYTLSHKIRRIATCALAQQHLTVILVIEADNKLVMQQPLFAACPLGGTPESAPCEEQADQARAMPGQVVSYLKYLVLGDFMGEVLGVCHNKIGVVMDAHEMPETVLNVVWHDEIPAVHAALSTALDYHLVQERYSKPCYPGQCRA